MQANSWGVSALYDITKLLRRTYNIKSKQTNIKDIRNKQKRVRREHNRLRKPRECKEM